jgi:uncharacterized membrane protein
MSIFDLVGFSLFLVMVGFISAKCVGSGLVEIVFIKLAQLAIMIVSIIFTILFGIVMFADSQTCKTEAKRIWDWGLAFFILNIINVASFICKQKD